MTGARYLVRFDDLCPTANWVVWERIETILDRHAVKPIVAVVPDNQDKALVAGLADMHFWARVRKWQAKGWAIGLHGHQHLYVSQQAGLLGLNPRSEFAGLPYATQKDKIVAALAIFRENRVEPDIWVAPAHSFDATTIRVLDEAGLHVISDGFYWRVVTRLGATWIPQQLWRFRDLPAGLWTVCYHPNRFSSRALDEFEDHVSRYQARITSLKSVLGSCVGQAGVVDRMFSRTWGAAVKLKRWWDQ